MVLVRKEKNQDFLYCILLQIIKINMNYLLGFCFEP